MLLQQFGSLHRYLLFRNSQFVPHKIYRKNLYVKFAFFSHQYQEIKKGASSAPLFIKK